MNAIVPLAESAESVTLARADYDRLLALLDEEDRDLAATRERRAREAEVGKAAARADYLTDEQVGRLLAGESPVRVWREHRGLTQRALAEASGISVAYLIEIEGRKKPGSARTLAALARALRLTIEDLLVSPPREG